MENVICKFFNGQMRGELLTETKLGNPDPDRSVMAR